MPKYLLNLVVLTFAACSAATPNGPGVGENEVEQLADQDAQIMSVIYAYQRSHGKECQVVMQRSQPVASDRPGAISAKALDEGSCGPKWYRIYWTKDDSESGWAIQVKPWQD